MSTIVWETSLPGIQFLNRGKVRDLYEVGDRLLIVATDRLSAFDVVLPTPIPDKGRVLTQLSLFWFDLLHDVIPNHVLTAADFPPELAAYRPLHALSKNATSAG
jgi:phosphoribosylaminoimidazole-succinocarboxamide synthase